MRLVFTSFPPRFGPGLPGGKRRSFEPRSTTTISRPSVAPAPAGKLYMRVFEQSISGEEVVRFLRHVLREISGKLTIHRRASSPPGTNGQGVSCRRSLPAPPSGAAAGLCSGLEPGRGRLELSQERGDEEPLLSRPRSPQNRAPKSEGAAPPQGRNHQELLSGSWISLGISSHIGKRRRFLSARS